MRITELQGSKRARPERAKRVRANKHESLLVHESEFELFSGDAETESRGKSVWYSEEPDGDLWSGFRASIARQALSPGETVMCSFRARKQSRRRRLSRWSCFS